MKKVLAAILAIVLALGLCGCGAGDEVAGKGDFLGLQDGEDRPRSCRQFHSAARQRRARGLVGRDR